MEASLSVFIFTIKILIFDIFLNKLKTIENFDIKYRDLLKMYLKNLFFIVNWFFLGKYINIFENDKWGLIVMIIVPLIISVYSKQKIAKVDKSISDIGFYFMLSIIFGFLINYILDLLWVCF